MNCEIEWNSLNLDQWEERFARVRRANLLQSYDYARAACPHYRQKARWGLIRIDGIEAGMVQIFEAGLLGNVLHAVILDRGPLWFDGFGGAAQQEAFFRTFNDIFPRRLGRRRRFIPEIPAGLTIDLEALGYKRVGSGYQTIWLDIRLNSDDLRAGLDKKWRNILSKAERSGLEISWDRTGETLPWLLTNYQLDQGKKGYSGPSPALLRRLAAVFAENEKLLIGRALLDNRAIAAILILCHGRAATYQVGWTSMEGRDSGAHNFLLWNAIQELKQQAIDDFDLGGINDDTAQGVKKFKQGMGGDTVATSGLYL